MKATATTPAIQIGIDHVLAGITAGAYGIDGWVPSIATLARNARVSRATMWKAIHAVAGRGMVAIVPGGKITLTAPGSKPIQVLPSSLWQQQRAMVASDIAEGRYRLGQKLPSTKELCGRYDVSYGTLRKMLLSLVSEGLIVRQGKFFVLPAVNQRRYQSTVVVFSTRSRSASTPLVAEWMKIIATVVEKECAQARMQVRFVALDLQSAGHRAGMLRSLREDDSIAGYLFNLWMMSEWHKPQLDFIAAVAAQGKPLAVMDYSSAALSRDGIANRANVRIFRTDSAGAGRLVGRLLIQRGHRKIVFLSLWHDWAWSAERLGGIRRVFAAAGMTNGVTECVLPNNPRDMPSILRAALQDTRVTAWACANDEIALAAMEYLAGRRIKVPEQVAVAGFDNTILSFENKLTTVDFRLEALAYRMIQFIRYPVDRSGPDDREPVTVSPVLIERGTTITRRR